MDYVYKAVHPDQPEMFVAVVLASNSASTSAPPIVTVHARYPRIIHGEIMTHRKKSKNARSSRAVPTNRLLEEVKISPFVPWHWGRNQAGMQGAGDHNAPVELETDVTTGIGPLFLPVDHTREEAWLWARDNAVTAAEAFRAAGYHKQLQNRLLEPFSWIDTLITSTSWTHFLHLRDHKDAEPHFQDLARLFREALAWVRDHGALQYLEPGEWHLPYITPEDRQTAVEYLGIGATEDTILDVLKRVSAARCARISYVPFDGNPSFEREMERFDKLINSERLHASPTEHQATPDTMSHYDLSRVDLETDQDWLVSSGMGYDNRHLHGNFDGWVQFRKQLPGEYLDADLDFWWDGGDE